MAVTITLPEALARRVEAIARAQGRATETVVVEVLEAAVPVDPEVEAAVKSRFGFVASGDGPTDVAERHKEIRREHFTGRSAAES
jgi:predicted transcriptional regulator